MFPKKCQFCIKRHDYTVFKAFFAFCIREAVKKKNSEKAVRLTALGGGVTPLQPDQNDL